jgi:aldehyde dehydrogenase (NAD+)
MQAWKWGPALASGCTIVLKPAEQTPLTALRVAQLAQEAGFPDGVINVVPGFGPTAGAAVSSHPDIDKVAFTGEYSTGRLFGEEKVHDQFVDKMLKRVKAQKVGDPFDLETTQGPQVSQEQCERVMGFVEAGKKEGAKLLTGGNRVGGKGYFIEPTVFDGVTDDMKIAREEIFGPVMNILKFKDLDEVIQRGNATNFGLAAAVWTRDIKKAHQMANGLRAGTVWVNCYDVFDAAAPFGGFKTSGHGRELGEYALELYTEVKTVYVNLA